MAEKEYNFRQQLAALQIGHVKSYLLDRGWQQKPSRYVDHLFFENRVCDEANRFELYVPAAADVPRYETTLMRAIYKLCGIEDREPGEIAGDMLTSEPVAEVSPRSRLTRRLRIHNSGTTVLQVRIDSPLREHELLSGEAVDLNCNLDADGTLELERGDNSLTIVARSRN